MTPKAMRRRRIQRLIENTILTAMLLSAAAGLYILIRHMLTLAGVI